MNPSERRLVLKGRYVFPVVGAPIPNGSVTIAEGRIVAVEPCRAGKTPPPQEVRDLGNVAILPGLVNAHVHLDFSDLAAPLGQQGISFVDWIRRVMDYRRQPGIPAERSVTIGLAESIGWGVTTLGEIAQPGRFTKRLPSPFGRGTGGEGGSEPEQVGNAVVPLNALTLTLSQREKGPSPNLTVFQELIAPTAQRAVTALELAKSYLQNSPVGPIDWRPGLSPHAPYSVRWELLLAVVRLSAAEHVPVAMHLAESPEELELMRTGGGPLRVFLEQLGVWDATAFQPGTRPMDCLRRLALAHRALVIHGNYLDDEEIAFLGSNAERMAVVYCPRSHDWFGHSPYPLEKMLASGVTVALGTDGRGSSPDLSLLAEMRVVARQHPTVPLDHILQMGTIQGARVLGWDRQVGSLEPGKQADLAIVALPDRDAGNPYELLFESDEPVVGCYFRGVEMCLSPDFPNRRASSSSTSTNETPQ